MEISIGGISHTEVMLFTKHLAVAIKSGLTLQESLEMLEEDATGKLKKVLGEILEIISSGQTLSTALSNYPKYFSSIYINLVKTGEISGTLDANLAELAKELKKAHDMRQKVKSAMMYPMLVFIAVAGLGLSVATFVLPKILPLFETLDVELPLSTRALIFIAGIFENHGIWVFGGTVIGAIALTWLMKRKFMKPITHAIPFKIPKIKEISHNINLERFTRTLGILLSSGMTVDDSLQITADSTGNYHYQKAIQSVIPEIQKGNCLADILIEHPKLFPKIAVRMIGMGEKTGNLDNSLKYLSEYYEGEVDNAMKNLSTVLEPILLIVIGVVVGTVALSILGPIYKITGNLRGSFFHIFDHLKNSILHL